MRIDFEGQLKWFTKKLIEIRVREIKGYHLSIDFDLTTIRNCTIVDFSDNAESPKESVINMLTEIKGNLLRMLPQTRPEPSWTVMRNGHIKIEGFTTDLLRLYFKNIFPGESICLFRTSKNRDDETIIIYSEQVTDICLTKNESAIFRCLFNKFDEDVTFLELFEAIKATRNLLSNQRPLRSSDTITETGKAAVTSAVDELRDKLKGATGFKSFPEIIQNIRGIGYKMII